MTTKKAHITNGFNSIVSWVHRHIYELDTFFSEPQLRAHTASCADTGFFFGWLEPPPPPYGCLQFFFACFCPGPCNNLDPLLKFLYETPPSECTKPPLLNPGSTPEPTICGKRQQCVFHGSLQSLLTAILHDLQSISILSPHSSIICVP